MICKVEGCRKDIKPNGNAHFMKAHGITVKEYYDRYEKKPGEGKCIGKCGENGEPNDTEFIGLRRGYRKYCCRSCATNDPEVQNKMISSFKKTMNDKYGVDNPQQIPEVQEKTKETCLRIYGNEYAIGSKSVREKIDKVQKSKNTTYPGLIKLEDVCDKYGTGWYHKRDELGIEIIMKGRYAFIEESNIDIITKYLKSDFRRSAKESKLVNFISSIYSGELLRRDHKIINPYELDIVLPELKFAIEYNGLYWHSIEKSEDNKDYHLKKSLKCKENGYRLIHIYEFEDLEHQCELLKSLIVDNIDLYDPRDCNKNSLLITNETTPEIIYKSKFHTIYGVGKLY